MTQVIDQFDYGALPATQADELRAKAKKVRCGAATMTPAIINIGRDLLVAKQLLPHGRFSPWVEVECGFTARTAQNYMRVAEFADGKSETVSLLAPSVIYLLASKSAPPGVVHRVLQLLEAGQVPTERDVLRILTDAREIKAERTQTTKTELEARKADDLATQLLASIGLDLARLLAEGPWDQIGTALRLKLNSVLAPSLDRRWSDNFAADVPSTPPLVDLVPDANGAALYRPKVIEADYEGIPAFLDRTTWTSGANNQVGRVSS